MTVHNVMPVPASITNPTTGSGASNAPNRLSDTNGVLTANDFMSLLTAQLQAQDPLNPLDPTQFVNQLVQFNTLDQLVQIRQILQANQGSSQSSVPSTPGANK